MLNSKLFCNVASADAGIKSLGKILVGVLLLAGAVQAGQAAENALFKTMLDVPALNANMARAGMNSLQKRLGELRYMGNETKKHGVWARTYYKDTTVDELNKTDMNLWGVEAGQDWLLFPYNRTKLYVGGMLGYVRATSIRSKENKPFSREGNGYAPSVGLYATLVDDDLWFVDLAVRDFFTKTDMKSYIAGEEGAVTYAPRRNVLAWELEAGKTFEQRLSTRSWWFVTPKVGVMNMYAFKSAAHVTNALGDFEYGTTHYWRANAGIAFEYGYLRANGLMIAPVLDLGYSYEFSGSNTVSYGGTEEKVSAKGGLWEVDLGLNMQFTSQLYGYLLGSYEKGSKFEAWGGHAGIRFMFGNQPARPKTYADSNARTYTQNMILQEEVTYYVPMQQTSRPRPEVTTHYVHPKGNSSPVALPNSSASIVLDHEEYRPVEPAQAALLEQE